MRKLSALVFAIVMIMSVAFVGGSTATSNPFAVQAQTVTAKTRKKGLVRRGYAGGKWVAKKVYRGGKWVTVKTWKGTKWVGKKSWKTGRKVVSRTKKVVY